MGRRQPALPTLVALVQAAGLDLHIELRRPPSPLRRLSGPLGQRVRKERAHLVRTAARYGVSNLRVFGSVARGQEDADSDVDMLVDVPEDLGLLGLGRLRAELETTLQAQVDLVPADGLKPQLRTVIDSELIPL